MKFLSDILAKAGLIVDGAVTFNGIAEDAGTKTLRYDPTTKAVTYHDIPAGSGTTVTVRNSGLTISEVVGNLTFHSDDFTLTEPVAGEVLVRAKTFEFDDGVFEGLTDPDGDPDPIGSSTNHMTIKASVRGDSITTSNSGSTAGRVGLAMSRVGTDLPFKSLVAGTNITFDTSVTGEVMITAAGGGGGTPGGANTELQYNNAGAFGGLSTIKWNSGSNRLDFSGSTAIRMVGTAGEVDLSSANYDLLIGNGTAAAKFRLFAWGDDIFFDNTIDGALVFRRSSATTDMEILKTSGNVRIRTLDTGGTAPTVNGTTKMVITDADGQLSFADIPSGGSLSATQGYMAVGNSSNLLEATADIQWDDTNNIMNIGGATSEGLNSLIGLRVNKGLSIGNRIHFNNSQYDVGIVADDGFGSMSVSSPRNMHFSADGNTISFGTGSSNGFLVEADGDIRFGNYGTTSFFWSQANKTLSISGAGGGVTSFQVTRANTGVDNFVDLVNSSGGGIKIGGLSSSGFLPAITFTPDGTTQSSSMFMSVVLDPSSFSLPAFYIDSRKVGGVLVNQDVFGVGSYTNTYFKVLAGGQIWLNTVPNDDSETKLLTWNSTTKLVEYRDVSTISTDSIQLTIHLKSTELLVLTLRALLVMHY
jgi:hypothetical protein